MKAVRFAYFNNNTGIERVHISTCAQMIENTEKITYTWNGKSMMSTHSGIIIFGAPFVHRTTMPFAS